MPHTQHMLSSEISTTVLQVRHYYLCFTNKIKKKNLTNVTLKVTETDFYLADSICYPLQDMLDCHL